MEIMNFYENQTNRSAKQGMERIKKIGKYLKENHLSLNDVVLEHHIDYRWNQRRNRTKREQGARIIGQTNDTSSGFPVEIWWILPKEVTK